MWWTRGLGGPADGREDAVTAGTGPDGGEHAGLVEYAGLRETHSSVVFFVGDRVHKMKKPLDLGFLDNRTREARERICHREVELNRRLAPDVYLGVADVYGPDGQPCEHLVEMVRLPDDRRLAAAVRRGEDVSSVIDEVARQVAALHASSPHSPGIDRCASADFVAELWDLSLDHLGGLEVGADRADSSARIRESVHRYLAGRTALFDERIAAGRAVDGHGDLLADDIFCLDDGPRIIDCLEFDDELRYGDAVLDLAFLAMDLERLGAEAAARRLLEQYAEVSGDRPPPSLVHHYIAYRALVRAKVTALRYEQGDTGARETAAGFLDLLECHLDRGRLRMVLVGGVSATGKTTLARTAGAYLGAEVVRSDVVRKELVGLRPTDRTGDGTDTGLYAPAHSEATYREMLRRAGTALTRGRSVVLDATWLSSAQRDAARRVADDAAVDVIEIECRADEGILLQRMASRAQRGDDASDATPAVLERQLRRRDPWPEAFRIDTGVETVDETRLESMLGPAPW
ncbi:MULTISPECIES: AAA family ATPase [Rhodococcus]|uniref:bifunctional aminoglycoside phosphotransferase/ATP-binding protein n=1 Tax=Rhodococcus TaxID=1827 RepID=UPI00101F98A8|nr:MULTISPECIES: AAA family ATPase [Rhodococcus]UTT49319.1 AAA family ATPase [Rhodococcus gordoniae]